MIIAMWKYKPCRASILEGRGTSKPTVIDKKTKKTQTCLTTKELAARQGEGHNESYQL